MNEDTNVDMLELATPLIQNKGQWNEHGNNASRNDKCCHLKIAPTGKNYEDCKSPVSVTQPAPRNTTPGT